ncbi:MAG: hypothetical protein ACT4PS_14545 [Betaproteobacteria bacterium]
MNRAKTVLILCFTLAAALATPWVLAHGGHVRFGVLIGGPGFWYAPPPYYYYPPYYYPPVVTVPATPPVYIERNDTAGAERPASSYWYYCRDSKTYYPYVKECASPWQRVEPRPPGS